MQVLYKIRTGIGKVFPQHENNGDEAVKSGWTFAWAAKRPYCNLQETNWPVWQPAVSEEIPASCYRKLCLPWMPVQC